MILETEIIFITELISGLAVPSKKQAELISGVVSQKMPSEAIIF